MTDTKCYKVKIKQEGRGGWIYYIEKEKTLPFDWEYFMYPSLGVVIPSSDKWNSYCENHNASWAIDRREEILQRIGREVLEKQYGNGRFEINDEWLVIHGGHSLVSRLANYFNNLIAGK